MIPHEQYLGQGLGLSGPLKQVTGNQVIGHLTHALKSQDIAN